MALARPNFALCSRIPEAVLLECTRSPSLIGGPISPGPVQEIELEAEPGSWRLTRADPAGELAGLVVEYWEVQGALSAFRETLLPNGCVELMVNLGPPHRVLHREGARVWDRGWMSGLQERALVIESLEGTHLVSARLHPLGAVALLGRGVAGIPNSIVDLETFVGAEGEELRRRLMGSGSAQERFELLEEFLMQRATGTPAPDFVHQAVTRIDQAHGNLPISRLHEETGVSRKHLSVSFARYLGMSPKAYAKIRRFVWTLERLRECTEPDWPRLAGDAGYSDQSHLVRDFRRVGAASPTEYLRRWTPDGASLLEDG